MSTKKQAASSPTSFSLWDSNAESPAVSQLRQLWSWTELANAGIVALTMLSVDDVATCLRIAKGHESESKAYDQAQSALRKAVAATRPKRPPNSQDRVS